MLIHPLFFFKPRISTYRILVPWRGAEPLPSAVKAQGTNYWTVREFPQSSFLSQFLCVLAQSCWLFVTLQTITHQASLSMGFSRQEYWSGLPCPAPWDLPNPGIDIEYHASPGLQSDSFIAEPPGISVYIPLKLLNEWHKQQQIFPINRHNSRGLGKIHWWQITLLCQINYYL